REQRTVSEKSVIMVDSNEYSVPSEYRQQAIEIFKTETELFVFDQRSGREIARHELSIETGKRIIDRTHFRTNSRSLKDLKQETLSLFTLESWKFFVESNYRAFPRYSRDQCLLAKKYFSKGVDTGVFESALEYCLENGTHSMAELWDTYSHQVKEFEQEQDTILTALSGAFRTMPHPEPVIAKRNLEDYENLLTAGGGGTE
ncbi:hypothetical protein KA005_19530, partial [bacterium]|nr:hypothetical protein [bacterium]